MNQALLLLLGLMCDTTIWSAQHARFGCSAIVPGYGAARRIEDMAAGVLQRAPDRFALAGHSMGGRVALEIVRIAPERVLRLALLDTGVHPVAPGEVGKRHALRDLGRAEGMAALVGAWLPPMLHPARRDDPAVLEPLTAMCMRAGLSIYEAQTEDLLARPDGRPVLSALSCPTLVCTGEQDEWSPVEQHREIAAVIRGSHFAVLPDCGHMAPFEAPEAVNAALLDWLS